MAALPALPQNFAVQQGNLQVLISWSITSGATSYNLQRSTDGVNYTNLAAPVATSYLDTTALLNTQYYYQVAGVNTSGTGIYTTPQSVVVAPNGELSLGELRLRAMQRADRVNSQFVTNSEWNYFLNQSLYELYDLLITVYEDYFEAPEITFPANGNDYFYPLPNGILTFTNSVNNQVIVAPPFYKLSGVDLALNNANNAYVTVNKYNLIDRNRFVYPNTASTIYGVFNLQYRLMGNQIRFIPTPSGGQILRLLYIPRLPTLLQDTDSTTIGFSGWLQYVIVRAAKYALDKEESDTSSLDQELIFMKGRIEETAVNRDAGQPDKISDFRQGNWADGWWSNGLGKGGF